MTNEETYQRVASGLTNDVGRIIELVKDVRKNEDWCPWWALVRMLLPVAEALGGLKYGNKIT